MSFKFFTNRDCDFFPCHKNVDEEEFNCLFCFCPLYSLGKQCGGNFTMLPDGTKDCSACSIPHKKESGYQYVLNKIKGRGVSE